MGSSNECRDMAELVRLKVDIIVVGNVQGALAAKKATQTIPIVFATAADPVETGLVTSLAQPGGNMTGVTDLARDLAGKRLELLKRLSQRSRALVFFCGIRPVPAMLPKGMNLSPRLGL